jgi:hypothetical protein
VRKNWTRRFRARFASLVERTADETPCILWP